ncbi:hypothetical protein HYY69_04180 [Candidatus Woesearchaeota archaeon]|nr:hypothetical protein [Candidatus Woesearchaeota archaeon]
MINKFNKNKEKEDSQRKFLQEYIKRLELSGLLIPRRDQPTKEENKKGLCFS